MNIGKKVILKYLIAACIGTMFFIVLSNTNKTYAVSADLVSLSLSTTTYNYDGKSHKPKVYARYNGSLLTEGTSYYVSYPADTVNSGSKTIKVVFGSGFVGKRFIDYRIRGVSADALSVRLSRDRYDYDGYSHRPDVIVNRYDGYNIRTSYTVTYPRDTTSAGWKTVTISFTGNYYGDVYLKYHIRGIPADQVSIRLSQTNYIYDGGIHKPNVTLYAKGWKLTEGTSYTLVWSSDGKRAGTHQVTAYLKGNYEGYVWHTYTISKANIANATIKVLDSYSFPFTGKAQYPEFRVSYRSKQLGYSDFDYSFPKGNIAAEPKILRIQGRGNFYGYKDLNYTITKKNISNAGGTVKNIHNVEYTGQRNPPTPFQAYIDFGKTRLYYEEDFTYSLPDGGIKVGKQRLRINGIGNYCGSFDTVYTILRKDISKSNVNIKFLNGDKVNYTGQRNPPTPFEVYINGRRLLYQQDFTYSLPDGGVKAGRQKLRIHGMGNYTGVYDTYYTIRTDISRGSHSIRYLNGNKVTYTGQKNPPTPFEVYVNGRRLLYQQDFTYSLPYGGINVGTQKLRINGIGNYCGSFDDTYTIEKAKGVDAIINSAIKIKNELGDYDYCDYGYSCRGDDSHKHGHSCGLNETFEESKRSYKNTCCATYVSWVLRDAGIIDFTTHGADSLAQNLIDTGKFNKVNDIKAGDILCYRSSNNPGAAHIEISAGGNEVYNAGSVETINTKGKTKKSNKNLTVILRLK